MSNYALSGKADADVVAISEASVQQWGVARAEKYIGSLHDAFQMLAQFPDIGRDVGYIRPNYRMLETGSHVVFYRKTAEGVLTVRVLHAPMDFETHI